MTCQELRHFLPQYTHLPENDPLRTAIEAHASQCETCGEELEIWKQSEDLINGDMKDIPEELRRDKAVSAVVMKRIYSDEAWRLPVHQRMYAMSEKMRKNLFVCVAFCLALFVCSFLYALAGETPSRDARIPDDSAFTIQLPQKLDAGAAASASAPSFDMKTAIASVSQTFIEPIPFQMGPIQSYSNFLLIVSIIGFIGAMLILNWINRVKK